ncbi:UNVERIFIED_CONTAM: hypothetical protein Slati_3005100 [Sesamum latifolium]|uniref:Uncharacterized protein n=1 Tax=Sesamum latifolium TaxID=2727402 RepID=A0AAW2VGB3_9LAMI
MDSFLRQLSSSAAPSTVRTPSAWRAPKFDVVKINFGGATFAKEGALGIGVVARDAAGQCLA